MHSFLRYLFFFFIIVAITWIRIPRAYGLEFPRTPGPTFNNQVRDVYINRLENEKPELLLLGDSTLADAIDPAQMSNLMGMNVSSFGVPGSASAFWYVVLKNNIVKSENKPKYLIIVFRDSILTAPGYRVQGSYFTQVDEFARRREPVLLERAFLNLMNPLEKAADAYFPLYSARVQIRQKIDALVRYSLPGWIGCDTKCNNDSMYAVFQGGDLQRGELQNAIASAEGYLYTRAQLNFGAQVDRSFLPDMIQLAKENHIQLILVRLKNWTLGERETVGVKRYTAALSAYLEGQDVLFLDFGTDPRLTKADYADSLHLNQEGKILFTEMLAEALKDTLK